MKIFGYNILTDSELKKVEQDHWDRFKKYLKIKELWRIKTNYVRKPKCSACDDNRRLKITMPDGSFRTVSCSCDSSISTFEVTKTNERYIIAIKGDKVFMSDNFNEWGFHNRIIFNKSELINNKDLDCCFYVSRKLCEQAMKILKEQEQ